MIDKIDVGDIIHLIDTPSTNYLVVSTGFTPSKKHVMVMLMDLNTSSIWDVYEEDLINREHIIKVA